VAENILDLSVMCTTDFKMLKRAKNAHCVEHYSVVFCR